MKTIGYTDKVKISEKCTACGICVSLCPLKTCNSFDGNAVPVVGEAEGVTSESDYPGDDVVEIVNSRGDETTVYKLADGTYMGCIERHFTYNGTDNEADNE